MSLDTDTASNRKAALESLKFSKVSKLRSTPQDSSASPSSSAAGIQPSNNAPPLQSRDATVPSRYFPSTPMSPGNVLVPNSSPINPDSSYRPYHQAYYHPTDHDVSTIPGLIHSNPWGQLSRPIGVDSLSAPSGFLPNGSAPHASFQQESRRISDVEGVGEEGPPRKRLNRGSPSRDQLDFLNTPGSPEVIPPGPRRRVGNSGTDPLSTPSDDSMPDVQDMLDGLSKPRIVRGHRPGSSALAPSEIPTALPEANDPRFTRFKMTMPTHPVPHIQAAWDHAGGDVQKATALLSDPNWDPKPLPASYPSPAELTGRVREIDEATKAERAAAKEKGKKSMIYANRLAPDVKQPPRLSTPPTSKLAANLFASPLSPLTPAVAPPRRKRVKKMVVSDSELEFTDSEDDKNHLPKRGQQDNSNESRALEYFNTVGSEGLQELTGCTPEQSTKIIEMRPFSSVDDLNSKLGQGKKKAGPVGISPRMFQDCTNIFEGYGTVDSILEDCEEIGASLRTAIASWTSSGSDNKGKQRDVSGSSSRDSPALDQIEDGALSLRSFTTLKDSRPRDYLDSQPSLLADTVQLKDYQLLGVNWLHLLYRKRLSCILADEMGLGKTIQVISFFAHLKERGHKGPHLVVVPSSTLENWCREFARFAPSISVQTYYAGKDERPLLRQTLLDTQRSESKDDEGWEVLITTYNLAQGDDRDRKFFRRIEWDSCVFDEGHILKNFQSQRYQALLKFGSNWRLLLTGTPLQNNLQELVSLMNFILPEHFAGALDSLRAIFKVKGDSKVTLLAQERVSRAKKMMTPFVLRRRKDQVLYDLPKKSERIEWCEMTNLQKSIYNDALQRSRKTFFDVSASGTATPEPTPVNDRGKSAKKKTRANARTKDKLYLENSSNVLMDLRKAASHPMLFRTRFTDQILTGMTKQLLKEAEFKKRGALFELVKEDMEVMTDAELQLFAATYKSTRKYLQSEDCYVDAGKVTTLLRLLANYGEAGRKVLIFSQFTQILDILQAILKQKKIKYLLLTGSTPVDVRQSLVDEFTEDASISVFLLSTKAGGMGINLTAASVVIMFDQDFNPHNDRQAQDRSYRIGQTQDVEVIKLITRGTIEEDMLRLGETKLALDEAVAGDTEETEKGESAPEREMKTSLMSVLRKQFEEQQGTLGDKEAGGPTDMAIN